MRFEPNPDFERQLARAVAGAATDLARRLTEAIDGLRPTYEGRPVDEIKPALQAAWTRVNGGQISDPKLTQFAEAVRDGRSVLVEYNPEPA